MIDSNCGSDSKFIFRRNTNPIIKSHEYMVQYPGGIEEMCLFHILWIITTIVIITDRLHSCECDIYVWLIILNIHAGTKLFCKEINYEGERHRA